MGSLVNHPLSHADFLPQRDELKKTSVSSATASSLQTTVSESQAATSEAPKTEAPKKSRYDIECFG